MTTFRLPFTIFLLGGLVAMFGVQLGGFAIGLWVFRQPGSTTAAWQLARLGVLTPALALGTAVVCGPSAAFLVPATARRCCARS